MPTDLAMLAAISGQLWARDRFDELFTPLGYGGVIPTYHPSKGYVAPIGEFRPNVWQTVGLMRDGWNFVPYIQPYVVISRKPCRCFSPIHAARMHGKGRHER